jgi:hypothetical protein
VAHPGIPLAGFEETEVMTNEGFVRPVAARDGVQVCATLVPEVFPQPPDLSYPTLWDNESPLLVANRFGEGRAVYIANQTDRLNLTSGHPDHQRLLANALTWALAGAPPLVTLETPRPEDAADVHVTLLRRPSADGAAAGGTLYLHLVNYTGARGRPVRPPHPLGPLAVTLRLPAQQAPARADLLVAGGTVVLDQDGDRLTIRVPSLELYEVIRLTA